MFVQPDTVYRCTIVWHNQPNVDEDVNIYAGEFPIYLYETAIDESIFFSLPVVEFEVGYDEGEWKMIAVHEPMWRLSALPLHKIALLYVQAWWHRWKFSTPNTRL